MEGSKEVKVQGGGSKGGEQNGKMGWAVVLLNGGRKWEGRKGGGGGEGGGKQSRKQRKERGEDGSAPGAKQAPKTGGVLHLGCREED